MLGFTGSPLDRADKLRADPVALAAACADPAARFLLLDDLKPGMNVSGPTPTLGWVRAVQVPDLTSAVLLGLASGEPRFAVAGPVPLPLKALDARSAAAQSDAPTGAILAHARSLIDWHARHRFCANCGTITQPDRGGARRTCPACHAEHYPRTDPVAIMLVIDRAADAALLGRGARMPAGFLSALAGFVEVGESLEEAVRREIYEEAGIRVGKVDFVASQPWPFPSSLMLGCLADALTTDIHVDTDEIAEARWIPRSELEAALNGAGTFLLPPPLAIAHHLIRHWLEGPNA